MRAVKEISPAMAAAISPNFMPVSLARVVMVMFFELIRLCTVFTNWACVYGFIAIPRNGLGLTFYVKMEIEAIWNGMDSSLRASL